METVDQSIGLPSVFWFATIGHHYIHYITNNRSQDKHSEPLGPTIHQGGRILEGGARGINPPGVDAVRLTPDVFIHSHPRRLFCNSLVFEWYPNSFKFVHETFHFEVIINKLWFWRRNDVILATSRSRYARGSSFLVFCFYVPFFMFYGLSWSDANKWVELSWVEKEIGHKVEPLFRNSGSAPTLPLPHLNVQQQNKPWTSKIIQNQSEQWYMNYNKMLSYRRETALLGAL